ncbi:MAG: FtsX-like permease family protein [Burkholderiales bacterium]
MTLLRLALAYARRRPLSTLLVVILLAVGVATVTLTLLLSRELADRLTRDAAGIDLVVGAKGSPLQLVLAGVYHVDVPPGNIPLAAVAQLRANPLVAEVIPLALGDSFRGFRIVGTEPAFPAHYGATLRDGRLWQAPLEAVVGSAVAAATGVAVGDAFAGSHGLAEGGGEHANARYRVTGVLAPTGTVLDRLVLTAVDSVWAVHEHHAEEAHVGKDLEPEREVTLVLVRYASPLAAATLPRAIDRNTEMVAASPAWETARLMTVFGAGFDLIRAFALLLVAASGFMLFVALAQALEDRRYDLAILRALGASRRKVASVLLIESIVLTLAGTVAGIAVAHAVALAIGMVVPDAAPLSAAALRWLPEEWAVVALALGAGILAALWPAWRAMRVDVAATLADN